MQPARGAANQPGRRSQQRTVTRTTRAGSARGAGMRSWAVGALSPIFDDLCTAVQPRKNSQPLSENRMLLLRRQR